MVTSLTAQADVGVFTGDYKAVLSAGCDNSRDLSIKRALLDGEGRACNGLSLQQKNTETFYFCHVNGPTQVETGRADANIKIHTKTTLIGKVLEMTKTYPDFPDAKESINLTKNADGSISVGYDDYVQYHFNCLYIPSLP